MKNKLWLLQLPFVILFTMAFYISDLGSSGTLENRFLRDKIYNPVKGLSTTVTDWKFKLRGPEAPKNKVVIIAIDNDSIQQFGRWPWHRDLTARLIDNTLKAGAKVVGLDITFSESDQRVPDEIANLLKSEGRTGLVQAAETDHRMTEEIFANSDKIVLGWTSSDEKCQPLYVDHCAEVVQNADTPKEFPAGLEKFAFTHVITQHPFDPTRTAFFTMANWIMNTPDFSMAADHAGYFSADPDPDGYIRRTPLFMIGNAKPYPSLPLEIARVGLKDDLELALDDHQRVKSVGFIHSGKQLPITPLGTVEYNFRGPGFTYPYISAVDVLNWEPKHAAPPPVLASAPAAPAVTSLAAPSANAAPSPAGAAVTTPTAASAPTASAAPPTAATIAAAATTTTTATARTPAAADAVVNAADREALERKAQADAATADKLKDAYAIVGATALGIFDMRAFPFDSNVAGVEGHATLVDNILAGDVLIPSTTSGAFWWILSLMIFGGVLFSLLMQRFESVPALLLFVLVIFAAGYLDIHVLFKARHTNWDTAFFYSEIGAIFIFTIAAKYVIEERSKKFIRGAFAKYVAPAVVDSILKDPTKLTVGGEKRDLTIMFSDIRSFTTFSERMDAKKLSQFLNDYLGIMTGIVFANEGTLDKYIGDAVMAFWGAPLDQPKHAANACKTAVKMMKALNDNKERFLKQYGVDVNIGVGVNSGTVSVGNMGSNDNFAYTVIGDHVNLASRMEGLTKPYGASIVTSRFTFDSIQAAGESYPAHRVLDFVKVKGKKNAVELIEVLDREMPEKGLVLFQEGRILYQAQKWDDAIRVLREASSLLIGVPGEMDGPSEVFIERCEEFKRNPPGTDWDGAWVMTSK